MAAVSKPSSLQQAASAVFAMTTVVPLLVFVWTLLRLGALSHVQSQVGLGLALGIALLGFYIFRRLMGQMSQLIHGLGRVVQQGMRPAADSRGNGRARGLVTEYRPPVRDHQGQSAAAGQAASARGASTSAPATPSLASAAAELARPAHRSAPIPGLGMIREVDDLSHAMAKLWMAEAIAYKGRRVALSIMNTSAPITGTLLDVTQDELLMDQDGGGQVTVSYGRLSGIDAA
jgi:hypothetical protein